MADAPIPDIAHIAAVAPIYRGEMFVGELCARLHATLGSIHANYRIVLVDDASPDQAWDRIAAEAARDRRVVGIQLSRNFGQHIAIAAGLDQVEAEWTVIMDGDLQDLPEDIPLLYQAAIRGLDDVVIAERTTRRDPVHRVAASAAFYRLLNLLTGLRLSPRHGNFRIINRTVLHAVRRTREHMRFFPAFMQVLGFRMGYHETHRQQRNGTSSYDLGKLARLAYQSTIAYSGRPLHVGVVLGLAISAGSLAVGVVMLVRALLLGVGVSGWASLFTLISFVGGLQILLISIAELYVGKTFAESSQRPLYFVRARTSDERGRQLG